MKNIHIPSRLILQTNNELRLSVFSFKGAIASGITQNIYITSDEIGEVDYVWWEGKVYKYQEFMKMKTPVYTDYFSIILTTDQDLIKDGVQAIDDEFLEWFVNNPSCEEVEVIYDYFQINQDNPVTRGSTALVQQYKIIIPKEETKCYCGHTTTCDCGPEEPKQETLEEAAERLFPDSNIQKRIFIKGAKWQQKTSYSEEEVINLLQDFANEDFANVIDIKEWFDLKRDA